MNASTSGDSRLLSLAGNALGRLEDRRYARFAVNLPAIKINDLGETWQGYLAPIINLSERGICLRIPFLLAMGNSFNFELALPESAHVVGTAQVRWTKSEGGWLSWTCGCEIIGLNPAQANDWEAYIVSLQRGVPFA